jgi:type VI secretion system protein ImpF
MADRRARSLPRESVLDRLIDPDPPALVPEEAERRVLESVRRDLEWLLNTRRPPTEPAEALVELRRSVYMFGLPDLSSLAVRSKKDRSRLQILLHESISLMEPRLQNVRVSPAADVSEQSKTLRFIVEATLVVPPCVQRVAFNTMLDLGTGECRVGAPA